MAPRLRIVLQARLGSQRLPGKALLPLGGRPAAILAAKRAARGGLETVVATSAAASDDPLAALAEGAGLGVFRGRMEDVLARFVGATDDLGDDAVIVRLTGDNPVPDSDLVAEVAAALLGSGCDLAGIRWPEDRLPYGVSVEAVRLGALRRAHESARDPAEREHVTPWLWRETRSTGVPGLAGDEALDHLRATIDGFDDWLRLHRAFAGVDDPVRVSWRTLVERLATLPDAPRFSVRGALVLGTAQLAEPYGAVVRTRPPPPEEAAAIVREAIAHGVSWIDTARAYGGSEERIGAALAGGWAGRARVVTKLDPRARSAADAEASVFRSCRDLRLPALDTVVLHRAEQLDEPAWCRLEQLAGEGVVGRLGVSAAAPDAALRALAEPAVRHLQLPYNLLDQRWEEADLPARLAARPDVAVHARSALLQGTLLHGDPRCWPSIDGFDPRPVIAWLECSARDLGRDGVADLCLAWVRSAPWVHGTVVGVERLEQLHRNLRLFTRPLLTEEERVFLRETRPPVPERLLDPAGWPAA